MTLEGVGRAFRLGLALVVTLAVLTVAGEGAALASAGCDRVNRDKALDIWTWGQAGGKKTVSEFSVGDVLDIRSDTSAHWKYLTTGDGSLVAGPFGSLTYTVTGKRNDTTLTLGVTAIDSASGVTSSKCTPVAR
jgi:hypothetical protein